MNILIFVVLALLFSSEIFACAGIEEPAIKDLITASNELDEFIVEDKDFTNLDNISSPEQQRQLTLARMIPVDFREERHKLDYYTVGRVEVTSPDDFGNPNQISGGTAVKVGKRCVLTVAHNLYGSGYQKMSSKNGDTPNFKIIFIRGLGAQVKAYKASVFFQMTKEHVDYYNSNKNSYKSHEFFGNHDLILLKLDANQNFDEIEDSYFKKLKVIDSQELSKNMDANIGKKINCMGFPSHKTRKTYGSCSGDNFLWKQDNARIFRYDTSTFAHGMSTNLGATPGMSGGPCSLSEDPDQSVFAIESNGYSENNVMPKAKLSIDEVTDNARYLALLSELDHRLKKEKGYGLDQISEKCK